MWLSPLLNSREENPPISCTTAVSLHNVDLGDDDTLVHTLANPADVTVFVDRAIQRTPRTG